MQLIKQKEHAYSVIQNQQQQGQDRTARQVISWSFFFLFFTMHICNHLIWRTYLRCNLLTRELLRDNLLVVVACIKLNDNLSEIIVVAAVNEAIVDGEVPTLEALAVSVNLGEDSVPVQI